MTVKELKEKLNQFPDNLIVMIPMSDCSICVNTAATNVTMGVNEFDGFLYINDYVEED